MPLKYTCVLESRNHALPTKPHKPSHMLIMDDCQGTNLYGIGRTDLMSHISIKHRPLPLTICFLVQSWTGLPRVIRLNATHTLWFVAGVRGYPPLFAERNSNSSAVIFIFFSVRNALTEYVCQFRNWNLSW